jgi:archaellum component FlaC
VFVTLFLYTHSFIGGGGWTGGTKGAALTGGQQTQIQALQERDAEFDNQLDEMGEGIQDLADIAELQSEEVQRQNQMLDDLGTKMDSVHEHVQNVNLKMKDTLKEVGRSSDKLCVDIMCIVSYLL